MINIYNNGLSPGRRQTIIWTNARILLIRPLGTNFNEILIEIYAFSLKNTFENVVWKMAGILSRHLYVKHTGTQNAPKFGPMVMNWRDLFLCTAELKE